MPNDSAGSPAYLYPAVDAAIAGYLTERDGHEIYFEVCGNPRGIPVIFLHGGPGSSCNTNHRRFFDPDAYRIVLFDQRGCGRSRPRGGVEQNTTPHLVADMEALRRHLNIDRWMLFGGSWGSTLALAYARAFPERLLGMVLRGVFLASDDELDWYCMGLRAFVPEAWRRLSESVAQLTWRGVLAHYWQAIQSVYAAEPARRWNDFEAAVMVIGEAASGTGGADAAVLVDRVRVQLHYLINGCFLSTPLLDSAARIHVPVIIVQGRRDLICPPRTAYDLHRAIAGSELVMVESGGHSAMHPDMVSALVRATDGMKARILK